MGEGWGEGGNRPAAGTLPPYRVIVGIEPGRTAGEGEAGVGRERIGIVTDSFNNKQTSIPTSSDKFRHFALFFSMAAGMAIGLADQRPGGWPRRRWG